MIDIQYIPIETSARHIHLSEAHYKTIFGENYILHEKKRLSQIGQFACIEKVKLRGSRGECDLTVLMPFRKETQIEISLTDARFLGIDAPIRDSGDIDNSAGGIISSLEGEVKLDKGIIIAKRHLHIGVRDSKLYNIEDGQNVSVELGEMRKIVLCNITVRVSNLYTLALHIDTDEANAAGLVGESFGKLLVCEASNEKEGVKNNETVCFEK